MMQLLADVIVRGALLVLGWKLAEFVDHCL